MNIGRNPTVDVGVLSVETNIFDFSEDIYGKIILIEVLENIRYEKKFSSVEELKEQIGKDAKYWKNKISDKYQKEEEIRQNMENMIQIKIENFEGPLDLLLHLIEKKKMDINSINVSQIIDDYLNYIHAQKELNLKIKVEFLIMATDLIEIKAYSILNRDKKFEKIENLEKKIIEYQLFKEISELFSKYENEYNVPYTRTGTESIGSEIEYDISSLNLDNLFKSLKNLINSKMMKKDNFEERMILNLEDDNYSTEEGIKQLRLNYANNESIQDDLDSLEIYDEDNKLRNELDKLLTDLISCSNI